MSIFVLPLNIIQLAPTLGPRALGKVWTAGL